VRRPSGRRRAVVATALASLCAVIAALAWTPEAPASPAPFRDFGMSGTVVIKALESQADRDAAFQTLQDLGVRWLRVDVQWDTIEKTKGKYTWGTLDHLLNDARNWGMQMLALVQRTPAFYRPSGSSGAYPPVGSEPLTAYSAFVTALMRRYANPAAPTQRLGAVEVWNEPNTTVAWAGGVNPARYVGVLQKAFTSVKAVNSAVTVVSGGLATVKDTATTLSPRTFLLQIYAAGAEPYLDAVGMHPYTYPALPADSQLATWGNMTRASGGVPSMRSTMEANGDAAKQIWTTEFGSPAAVVGEAKQATMVTRAVQLWTGYPWAGPFFTFSYHDVSTGPKNAQSMGLLRLDDTRRPVFTALQTAIAAAGDPGTTTTTTSSTTTTSTSTTSSTTTTTTTEPTTTSSTETTTSDPGTPP